MSQIDS